MLKVVTTNRFEKELRRAVKRGQNLEKIKPVMNKLANKTPLELKYKDHKLSGDFNDCRECHIEPDWLLVYRKTETSIIFEATGSHADLF